MDFYGKVLVGGVILKPKTFFKLVILLSSILTIVACSANEDPTVEEQVMKRVPFPKSTNILHIEDHRDGKVILYNDETGFRAGYYIEKDDYFQSTANAHLNPEDGFDWTMDNAQT